MKITVGPEVISSDGTSLTAFCRNLDSSDKSIERIEWRLKDGQCFFKSSSNNLSIEQEALKQVLPRLSSDNDLEFAFCIALTSRLEEPLSNP